MKETCCQKLSELPQRLPMTRVYGARYVTGGHVHIAVNDDFGVWQKRYKKYAADELVDTIKLLAWPKREFKSYAELCAAVREHNTAACAV